MTTLPYQDGEPREQRASVLDTARRVAHNMDMEMKNAGMTQADLAPVLKISQQAVSDRLTGRTPLTLAQMDALKELFGLDSVTQLIEGRKLEPTDRPRRKRRIAPPTGLEPVTFRLYAAKLFSLRYTLDRRAA